MNDFVAYSSRWRVALIMLGAVAFVAIGLWMVGTFGTPPTSRKYPPAEVLTVGWISIFFFGLCGVAMIKRLFDTREQVRIGRSGVRPSPRYDEIIPWSEIIDVTTNSAHGQKFINLHLRDPARFPQRGVPAFVVNASKMLGGGDISINLTGTDGNFDEAMLAIERFRRI